MTARFVAMPGASLAELVDAMQADPDLAGGALAGDPPAASTGAPVGVARILPGAELRAHELADFEDKTRAMAALAAFLDERATPRKHVDPIEQCVDEMLMNALYDAPVGADGRRVFAGVPTRTRVTMRTAQTVRLEYAHAGTTLAIAVHDTFGSLDRETILRFLYKSLHATHQVDRKAGGAGLGLYLMASSATAIDFEVIPGVMTVTTCTFELAAPRLQLERLAFHALPADGTPPTPAARALPAFPNRRRLRIALAALGVVALVGLGLGAWRLLRTEPRPPPSTVMIESQPPGAMVTIDDRSAGTTPATVTTLAPGRDVTVAWSLPGYASTKATLRVPPAGQRASLAQKLERSADFVEVHVVSTPPGALVVREGQDPARLVDRTYTPATIFVEAGKPQRFTLVMPGRAPFAIPPFTPVRGVPPIEVGGTLVEAP